MTITIAIVSMLLATVLTCLILYNIKLSRELEEAKVEATMYKEDARRIRHDFVQTHEGDVLHVMMLKQRELYDLNGMPDIDFDRPLGLRAQRCITEGIGDFTKSAIHECVELEDWTQWKPWSRQLGNKWQGQRWSEEHIKEMRMEVIDLLAFVFNLCCLLGISWQMLYHLYLEKMTVNIEERHNSGKY